MMERCSWVNENNPLYVKYHDEEWGVPCYDDRVLFELLVLESFQAGLSWECILNKREAFRKAFADFDVASVSSFDYRDVERLMYDRGIVRNRRKIEAAIANAAVFIKIREEYGSFCDYIWGFTGGKQIVNLDGAVLTASPLSDTVSKDLKRRGMRFVGSTIIYSYLQAIGVIYDHEACCELGGQK